MALVHIVGLPTIRVIRSLEILVPATGARFLVISMVKTRLECRLAFAGISVVKVELFR